MTIYVKYHIFIQTSKMLEDVEKYPVTRMKERIKKEREELIKDILSIKEDFSNISRVEEKDDGYILVYTEPMRRIGFDMRMTNTMVKRLFKCGQNGILREKYFFVVPTITYRYDAFKDIPNDRPINAVDDDGIG